MDIHSLLKEGTNDIMKTLGRYYLNNKRGIAFLASILPKIKQGMRLRDGYEQNGLHVPPFLISSIASECNLFCAGCYARCGGACAENARGADLTASEWRAVFEQAAGLGVSFVLLAGGEPLMRRDVIEAAVPFENMIFPVFTNGLLLDETYIDLFHNHRHIVPILSIEGGKAETDERRGAGVYDRLMGVMDALHRKKLLFGASITVTTANLAAVLCDDFIEGLYKRGGGVLIFTEYVPLDKTTRALELSPQEADRLNAGAEALRGRYPGLVVLTFPGDERSLGGCLASGRGFFHISPDGGAEPCPFSPYSKHNVKTTPMPEILQSPYFAKLQELAAGQDAHAGGCVLFRKEEDVVRIVRG